MKKRVLSAVMTAAAMLLGAVPYTAVPASAEQEFAFLDPTEQAFCERVAGWENAELDDCIPLRRESGELQLLTPQKPYEIDLIRQGRYRIYLSGDSLPDSDLVLDRWKDMLRAVNYPEKTMERWTCSFTPADGGYDVSCGQEAYLGVSLVDCLKSFPEVRSIDAQFGYMTEDRPNEAYDFFFNFRYSAGTPEPEDFPGLDVAAVRQKGLWEEGCDLELQDSSYAAYFAAVPNLQANQFVSDLHISFISTLLADENDDAKMSLPERTILWRRGDPETCLSEFFELPLNEIGEMFPGCPKGGDQIIIGITHAQLERLMNELEPEMERIGKDAGLFKDAFFGLLMEKLHLNGIYETFDPDYFEASLPSGWLLHRYPFTLRECDEWEEDAACMVTLRYHYPYGPDGAIDSLSLEHEGQCITISTDSKEQIPDALYELTLRSLYVINKYGDRDYFTDAFTEGGPCFSDEGQPETPEITDVEQMREMLNAYVEENQIDARIVSNKEYPGYQPIVVEYDGDRAPDAWKTVIAYIDEQKMDRTKIGMVRIENGVAVTTVNCTVTIAQSGDVDCNGQTAIADAVLLARYLAEDTVEVSAQGLQNAELDGNPDSLDAGDFAKLLQIIAGCADA